MFRVAREILINRIRELESLILDLEKVEDKDFVAASILENKNNIEDIESALFSLNIIQQQKLKLANEKLRKKAILRNEKIKIKTVKKEGKTYAIVPIEILPRYLRF